MSLVATLGLAAGALLAVTAGPAVAAGTGSVTVDNSFPNGGTATATPNQNITAGNAPAGDVISISGSGLPASQGLAITFCANAHTDGITPVTQAEMASQAYCFAASQASHIVLSASTDSSGNFGPTGRQIDASGIGSSAGTCVARRPGMLPCMVVVADTGTQGGQVPGPASTSITVQLPVFVTGSAPAPTVTTTVTGQTNGSAGRAGSAITLSGANWQNATSGFTVGLCTTATGTGCDALTVQSASVTNNNLSASATIPATPTTGSRFLVVSNTNGDTAVEPFTVLGTPTVTLSPNAGGPGTLVQVSGTNWDTGANVNAFASTGVALDPPLSAISTGTVGTNGSFSGVVVTVTGSNTHAIAVAQGASLTSPDLFPGTTTPIAGGAPFTFSDTSCVPAGQNVVAGIPTAGGPDANTGTANGCSLLQTVNLTVNGSTLQFSEAGSNVTLTAKTLSGADQTTDGAIQQLKVNDSRGSLAGWVVVATMNDLTDGTTTNHHVIPAGNLSTNNVACAPVSASTGVATDVAVGAGGTFDPTTPITLCTAAAGGGGGTFTIDSGLSLLVPASIAAGHYSATMTFLIT